ncbi:MAG: phage Gp37/Gp68 family protein [Clostridiales bacterium]|nr:phage Gp37/Gp68 family protein [Clostridiales bacterium]
MHCYIYKGDAKRNINTNEIVKTKDFEKPIEKLKNADYKLSIFKDLPIKHKCITAQPLLEKIDIEKYLDGIELVVVGGESDINARVFNYDWALDIREQCIIKNVDFEFRQCGTYTVKDGKQYKIQTKDLCKQARLANINYKGQALK